MQKKILFLDGILCSRIYFYTEKKNAFVRSTHPNNVEGCRKYLPYFVLSTYESDLGL